MPVLHGVTEKSFKKVAKRLHRSLTADLPANTLGLARLQDSLSQAMGLGPLHEAQQRWAEDPSKSMPVVKPPTETSSVRNPSELSRERQIEALCHAFKRSVLMDCLRQVAPELASFQESTVVKFYPRVSVTYHPLGDRYALRLGLSSDLHDHRAFQPEVVLGQARRQADQMGCLVYVSVEADQRPWTVVDQEAWLKLPNLFRDAPEYPGYPFEDTPQRRRERLRDWAERGPKFQEGVRAADQGKTALLAWAKRTWTDDDRQKRLDYYSEDVAYELEGFLVGADHLALYVDLLRELPSKALPVSVLARSPHGSKWLWGHPQATKLMDVMTDKDTLNWMAEAVFPTQMLDLKVATDSTHRERLIQPWLAKLTPRMATQLNATWKAHRERFQLRDREFVHGYHPPQGVLLDESVWERLPKVWLTGSGVSSWRFDYYHSSEKESRMRFLVDGYQATAPLFRAALEALERQEAFKQKQGMRPKVNHPTPWQAWLKENAGEALWSLRGPWPDPDGVLVERSFREVLIERDRHVAVFGEDNLADWFAAGGP